MIKFVYTETEAPAVIFRDVKINQFFISSHGYLCQKTTLEHYNIIADGDGRPFSDRSRDRICKNTLIKKILPEALKIEF